MLLKTIMSKDQNKIVKGIKFLAIALPLMVLGPVILTIGFRALKDGIYLWLILGCLLLVTAVFLAFLGVKTILNGIFEKDES